MEKHTQAEGQRHPLRNPKVLGLIGAVTLLIGGLVSWGVYHAEHQKRALPAGHTGITTTVFWIGEPSDADNAYIPNNSSTWVENWQGEFGGVDDPNDRCNNLPCGFTPKENPYYIALPYSDLDQDCHAKPSQADIPWVNKNNPPANGHSAVKNKFIKIKNEANGKVAYAQWEDAGPLGEDDAAYVFGTAPPHYKKAGLDVSPAVAGYLGLDGEGKTSWKFISTQNVPDGPWRRTITTSPPDCAR